MAAPTDYMARWRKMSRGFVHETLASVRENSSPPVARRITRLQRWLSKQEREADRRRLQIEGRIESGIDDAREALAAGIRRLQEMVRPA